MLTLTLMQNTMSAPQLELALSLFQASYGAFFAAITPKSPKSVFVKLMDDAPGEIFIEVLSHLCGLDLSRCRSVRLNPHNRPQNSLSCF